MRIPVCGALLATLMLLALPAAAFDADAIEGVDYAQQPRSERLIMGQPEREDLARIAAGGGQHVVNLRGEGEFTDWDAGELVEPLGMTFHHIPVRDGSALTRERVQAFDQVLAEIGDAPALIYCGSGNRVGAMFALRAAWLEGQDVEEAVALGREHGLAGLEGRVRELLAKSL